MRDGGPPRPSAWADRSGPSGRNREDPMTQLYDIGMVGLGVMGRNLLLNLADHGYHVIGLDTDKGKVQALKTEGARASVDATTDAKAFLAAQRLPRAIILLVPAGKAVDAVINELVPSLSP